MSILRYLNELEYKNGSLQKFTVMKNGFILEIMLQSKEKN